jgi:hypothetical protein
MQMPFSKKKTGLQELLDDIARLERQRGILDKKVATARSEYEAATAARLDVYTKSDLTDPKAEQKTQGRVDAARNAVEGFAVALEHIERDLAAAQQRADEEGQNIERAAAADEIDRQVLSFEKTVEPALMALRAFSKAASELDHLNFDVAAISRYAHVAGSELEVAAALAVAEMRAKATSVRAGHDRIPRRDPAPAPPLPPPALDRIWLRDPVAWMDGTTMQIRDNNQYVDLPPILAKKAISIGAAVPLGHAEAGKKSANYRQFHGYGLPAIDKCKRLDDAESPAVEEQPGPKILHSRDPNFQVVDRGPAYTLKTNGPQAA